MEHGADHEGKPNQGGVNPISGGTHRISHNTIHGQSQGHHGIQTMLKSNPYEVQKKAITPNTNIFSPENQENIAKMGLKGAPSEIPYRAEMEKKFGVSFDGVKAYTGEHAQKTAKAIGADAYTYGNEVAFMDKNPKKETVAHELTHVLQQNQEIREKNQGNQVIMMQKVKRTVMQNYLQVESIQLR